MHSGAWITLLKRIPLAHHNILTVRTSGGTEVNIQSILRLDTEFAVIRGRLAATTETGRVYFIPYDQIDYVGYLKEVKVEQIRDMFGEPLLGDGVKVETASSVGQDSESSLTVPITQIQEALLEPEAGISNDKLEAPSGDNPPKPAERFSGKEAILQRLRARTLATMKPKRDL
jgi:hypothetical protein